MKISRSLKIVLLLALILRVWNIAGPDMASDESLYAYRSVGYVDYLAAPDRQSTPVTWFDEAKWWQGISFHDAPPLVFIAERISVGLFGNNQIAIRLPFLVAGMLAVLGIYLLGKQIGRERLGLISATILAITNSGVWLSRTGYLDGFVVLFIIWSLYFFLKASDNPRFYIYFGLFCGLGMLTKYTFIFLLPVYLLGLILFRCQDLKNIAFLRCVLLFLLLVSPIIVYNIGMYQDRGHLDSPLSTMISEAPEDYRGLTRLPGFHPGGLLREVTTDSAASLVHVIVAVAGFYLLYRLRSKENCEVYYLLLGSSVFAYISLSVIGGAGHNIALLLPSVIIICAIVIDQMHKVSVKYNKANLFVGIIVILVTLEIVVTAQSQIAPEPYINHSLLISGNNASWKGYSRLEKFMANNYGELYPGISNVIPFASYPQLGELQDASFLRDIANSNEKFGQDTMIVFDERMDWFASLWIFGRRTLYERLPVDTFEGFLKHGGGDDSYYIKWGIRRILFVVTGDKTRTNLNYINLSLIDDTVKKIEKVAKPVAVIYAPTGEVAFEIYEAPL